MASNLFDQFMSPIVMYIPLYAISVIFPWILFHSKTNRYQNNRTASLQSWFIKTFTKQLMLPLNKGGHKWALMFASLMVFTLTVNTLGLLPYTFTPTTQLALNMALAVPLWMATVIIGMRNQPTVALAHLLPESTPVPLIPALIIIETISLFIRPLALGVRLTANLTAGHLLIQLISAATLILLPTLTMVAMTTALLLAMLTILEIAVALIQAYVFVLLLSLYLQENI